MKIKEIKKETNVNKVIQAFYKIESKNEKTTQAGKKYYKYTLTDGVDIIEANDWGHISLPEKTILVKVEAVIDQWNEKFQLNIKKIRETTALDGVDISDFVRTAPLDKDYMQQEILGYINSLPTKMKKLVSSIYDEYKEVLYFSSAAKAMHHDFNGGWSYHILKMIEASIALSRVYDNINRDLLVAGVILHDIEKFHELITDEFGTTLEYSLEGNMKGHLVMGSEKIMKTAMELGYGDEEEFVLMLQHMLLSHHGQLEFGSPKLPMFPEAYILHAVDMIDSRLNMFDEATRNIKKGEMSQQVYGLGKVRVYKPKDF